MTIAALGAAALTGLEGGAARAADIVVHDEQGPPWYVETGPFIQSATSGYGGTYRFAETQSVSGPAYCVWTTDLPAAGRYEVYAGLRRSDNRSESVPYTITHAGGTTSTVIVSQKGSNAVVEIFLGEYDFDTGTSASVRMDNSPATGVYIADAIIFRPAVDDPPVISVPARVPGSPTVLDTVTVTAAVTDDSGVTSVTLTYDSVLSGTTMVDALDDGAHGDGAAGDGVYGAFIPPHTTGDTVTYHFTAQDTAGQTASSLPLSYVVGNEPGSEYRVLWVDSWNASFHNEAQVEELVETCRASNINTIMAEIRKVGDAFYDSTLEPRAAEIAGDPDFDPLASLLEKAHDTSGGKKKIHVHGWFVMHRIAKSGALHPSHVLSQHPEYEMIKSDGTSGGAAAGNNRYLDPGHPGAVDHNIAVILDCISRYNLDGINLDYIRYPEYSGQWGYNAVSVARFNAVHGRAGQPSHTDPLWRDWRRECVSLEVKKLYVKAWKIRPGVVLTADTVNWGYNYNNFPVSSAYDGVFQDWVGWLNNTYFDYNALMNYSTDNTRFEGWTNLSLAEDDLRGSIIGIGAYLHSTLQQSMNQLLYARAQGAAGLNIYDWGSEVDANTEGKSRSDFYATLKAQVFPSWVDPPEPAWKSNPVTGIIEGTVTSGGQPVDHAAVMLEGLPETATVTDGSGWYGILNVPPGSYNLLLSHTGMKSVSLPVTITTGGQILTVDSEMTVPVTLSTFGAE